MADIPESIESQLKPYLTAIARLFKAPRITLIVRGPGLGDEGNAKGDLVLTNDNPLFAGRALAALEIGRAQILVGTPVQMDAIEKEPTPGGLLPERQDGGDPRDYQPNRRRQ